MNYLFSILFFVFTLSSCDEGGREKAFQNHIKLRGNWHLESLKYTDKSGEIYDIQTPNVKVEFITDTKGVGVFTTTQGDYLFSYNLGHETINLSMEKLESELPLYIPGRVSAYKIVNLNSKELRINAPEEYFSDSQLNMYNVVYTFKK